MIIVDIETSGLNPDKSSMLSLGAVDFENNDEFYIECRAYSDREVSEFALKVNGFTLEQVNDSTKPLPHEGYIEFLNWCIAKPRKLLLAGHNLPSFDALFLKSLHENFPMPIKWPFGYKYIDLHSVGYVFYGKSMSMDEILVQLGMNPEKKPHNGLTGARLERDCFRLLLPPVYEKP